MHRPSPLALGAIRAVAALAAASALAACPRPPAHPTADLGPDAPIALADDADFDLVRDRLWAMAPGGDRDAVRRQLTDVLVARAEAHLAAGKHDAAHADLLAIADLYAADPDAIGPALAPHVDALGRLRAATARAGADREAATALVLSAAAAPSRAADFAADLDEILAFVDDLAASEHGPGARGGAPIATLAPIAHALPARALVDRYVQLVVERQRKVAFLLDHQQATFDLVASQKEVASAARDVAAVLARAGRAPEIAAALAPIQGIGADDKLAHLADALRGGDQAGDWVAFARALRDGKDGGDPAAALAVCLAGRAKFPRDATLAAAAADAAAAMGRVEQPIALYEAARALAPADREVAHRLAPLYRERLARLAETGRPTAARAELDRLDAFYRAVEAQDGAAAWRADHAETLVAAGKGLLGQGDLAGARALLADAVARAPSAEGFDTLALIALEEDAYAEARGWTQQGLALPESTPAATFAHAKLLRKDGEAYAGLGDARHARADWLIALEEWADFGDKIELPPALAGERLVESARILWLLGEPVRGADLLDAAIDADDDDANTYIMVTSFLLAQGQIEHAAGVVHRALGADGVTDYNKIYLSLWVVAEAIGAGKPPDGLALDYLRARGGALWPDDLARLATGRADLAAVTARATTRARRAELAYYAAMLGVTTDGRPLGDTGRRALFDQVLASDLVLYFEYDMARRHGRPPAAGAAAR